MVGGAENARVSGPRPIVLSVAIAAAIGAFVTVVIQGTPTLSVPAVEAKAPPRGPLESLRDDFIRGDWRGLIARADAIAEDAGPPGTMPAAVRLEALLMRAWAVERLATGDAPAPPAGEDPGAGAPVEPPAEAWSRLYRYASSLSSDPDHPEEFVVEEDEPLYAIGWARRGLGYPDEAAEIWRRAVTIVAARAEARAARLTVAEPPANRAAVRGSLMMSLYRLACLRALLGETDAAIDDLAAASAMGLGDRAWNTVDPALVSLREHPRFAEASQPVFRGDGRMRVLLAEGRVGDAVWVAETALAYADDFDPALALFLAILDERSDDPARRERAARLWRQLLEFRSTATGALATPADLARNGGASVAHVAHQIGWALRGAGRGDEAEPYFEYFLRYAGGTEQPRATAGQLYDRACGLALLGRAGEALEALAESGARGYSDVAWALVDFDLDTLAEADIRAALPPAAPEPVPQ